MPVRRLQFKPQGVKFWLVLSLALLAAGAVLGAMQREAVRTPERRIVALLPAAQADYESGCRSQPEIQKILRYGTQAVPVLVEQLQYGDPAYHEVETYLLAGFGPEAAAAVPPLKQLVTVAGPGSTDTQVAAFFALAQIIPGDPCLLQYAEAMAVQGNRAAVYWLAREDQASRAVLLKLIRNTPQSRLKLLRAYTNCGTAPLKDISEFLQQALAKDDQPQFAYLPANDSMQPQVDNRWAEKALDARPDERPAILHAWAADFEQQDRGVQLYLLAHLDDSGMERGALQKLARRSDGELASAIDRALTATAQAEAAARKQKAAAFKKLVASIQRDPYQGGIHELTDYGAAGLEELHRLALQGDWQLGVTVLGALQGAEDKLGPEVLDVYYDIVLRTKGRLSLDVIMALTHYDADPQAFDALLARIVRELPGVDADKQGYLYGLYVSKTYPRPKEPEHKDVYQYGEICRELNNSLAYYERIVREDQHAIIRKLAQASRDEISAGHLKDCNDPKCPVRKQPR